MHSSSCFFICIQRTYPCHFSYIFGHTKRTPAKILPVSLLHFFKIIHPYSNRSYRNFFRSHIFSIHDRNNGNRLTWSNFLTLVPSGFASLLFSRFAFIFSKIKYHEVVYMSILLNKKSVCFYRIELYSVSTFSVGIFSNVRINCPVPSGYSRTSAQFTSENALS